MGLPVYFFLPPLSFPSPTKSSIFRNITQLYLPERDSPTWTELIFYFAP